ncbi:MAG: universal stress protein [Nitrospirae bacterium]|nr:MAG: universal stress protein [Nitrospirota bacterium]
MDDKADYLGPIKHILLSTDGSDFSEGAINQAIYFASSCIAKLSIIHVLEVNPEFETEGPKYVEAMERAAKEHLDFIRGLAAQKNVECDVIVRRTDEPYKAIVEEAAKRNSDVIVMGRRGKSALEKIFMGSVTARVIGHTHVNVLVVPRKAEINCKNILVATDGSDFSALAVSKAVDISKRCESKLNIVSVVPSEMLMNVEPDTGYVQQQIDIMLAEAVSMTEDNIKNALAIAEKSGVKAEGAVLWGRPYDSIVETAKKKSIDLIVVGSHGRTGLNRFLMGSVAERVVGLSHCAVLVVKAK